MCDFAPRTGGFDILLRVVTRRGMKLSGEALDLKSGDPGFPSPGEAGSGTIFLSL